MTVHGGGEQSTLATAVLVGSLLVGGCGSDPRSEPFVVVPPTCRDADGDGAAAVDCGGDDCDDSDATRHPRRSEELCNGRDDDCNPATEDDPGEGACSGGWAFSDATAEAGLLHEHGYDSSIPKGGREATWSSGGLAAGDVDSDGDIDVYAVGGQAGTDRLFLNQGDGRFAEAVGTGLPDVGRWGAGATFADIDGDGALDLVLGGVLDQGSAVFRNRGDGTFEDVTAASGLASSTNDFSSAVSDYDGDGDLDLFVAHWGSRPAEAPVEHLWQNVGDGSFQPTAAAAGIHDALLAGPFTFSFTPIFSDVTGDGLVDLLVAGDFGTSRVFVNLGGGAFADATTSAINDENGMGAAVGDFDGDGDLDWFVSSIFDPTDVEGNWGASGNRLYRNDGSGNFEDVSAAANIRDGGWGWGSCFADFDLDGDLDLFHTNGYPELEAAEFHDDHSRLFVNNGAGRFDELALKLGLVDRGQGRAVSCFDYDSDGDVDILVGQNAGPLRLWKNHASQLGHYLVVRLAGRAPNTEGLGAWVRIRVGSRWQLREIRGGSNYLSQDPALAHFGTGSRTVIDELEVRWPSGATTRVETINADQRLVIVEP